MNMNKKYIWISFISSAILISFAFKFYLSERQSKDVIQIKGLLKENIKIKKGRRSSKL